MNDSTVFPNLKVKVFGIGGAGNNAINNIIADDQFDSSAIEFWAINTDSQHLQDNRNKCENKLLLANPIYSGCGAGGDPKVGKECALNSIDQIKEILADTNVLILAAGLGGGTGTGATPVIADVAKKMGILTIAILTTPFDMEGEIKKSIALAGINEIKNHSNSYSLVSNQQILETYKDFPLNMAMQMADKKLKNLIKNVIDIINLSWFINIDFHDLKNVLENGQNTFIGYAKTSGSDKVKKAVDEVVSDNISEIKSNNNYKNLLVSFHIDSKGTLTEINEAIELLKEHFGTDTHIKFGIINDAWTDEREDFFTIGIIAGQGEIHSSIDYHNKIKGSKDNSLINEQTNIINVENTDEYDQIVTKNEKILEQNSDLIPDFFK
ncbi:cell division protein FtsZ [Mycoplasmopsis bovis]|uniref:Cell division protein FtsZ n=1 Tax=Mycoplasmopsis bovis (strain ATCC 25523 / DSM 22781 / NCTC 10131 / PG45) TaxID=289397 RepID=A0A454APL1_MYCBG|nr:cell division protein FtsZ [Mycoplasmopsis bovis]ADR25009.1 cell division protein FtsZ [Mycoplasmopsis bovis PG45]AXJ74186.1 cell division protein FtsZ [Mycoplasmopsis bovis]MBT1322611.1 cell division protein FtsZ [Mycoplasmopsis bovis]MBT1368131.1 cell division protein FtsZ [Mycoplasmopsis bovis]QLI75545.1 cell division protein FtsZ [Mycoplasmopsis bovis]